MVEGERELDKNQKEKSIIEKLTDRVPHKRNKEQINNPVNDVPNVAIEI